MWGVFAGHLLDNGYGQVEPLIFVIFGLDADFESFPYIFVIQIDNYEDMKGCSFVNKGEWWTEFWSI